MSIDVKNVPDALNCVLIDLAERHEFPQSMPGWRQATVDTTGYWDADNMIKVLLGQGASEIEPSRALTAGPAADLVLDATLAPAVQLRRILDLAAPQFAPYLDAYKAGWNQRVQEARDEGDIANGDDG
jgi:hypothetical protein